MVAPAGHGGAGYRRYASAAVQMPRFLRRARSLGFSVAQMQELLTLWRDERRASADVKRLALAHVAQLEDKARAIAEMNRALRDLADRCDGDHRPDCPIIDELASTTLNGAGPASGEERA